MPLVTPQPQVSERFITLICDYIVLDPMLSFIPIKVINVPFGKEVVGVSPNSQSVLVVFDFVS